jgi:hypothetical protein
MWQPAPIEIPDGEFSLFAPRFACEQSCEWYLQSGASATVKALSTGRLLLSLAKLDPKTTFSTDAGASSDVVLFEGFVVGDWKLPGESDFAPGPHAWDALTTAFAFYLSNSGKQEHTLAQIHQSNKFDSPVISHWKTVVDSVGLAGEQCGTDCEVAGIKSTNADVTNYFSPHTQQA